MYLKVLECSSRSLDVNPTENLWWELKSVFSSNSSWEDLHGGMDQNLSCSLTSCRIPTGTLWPQWDQGYITERTVLLPYTNTFFQSQTGISWILFLRCFSPLKCFSDEHYEPNSVFSVKICGWLITFWPIIHISQLFQGQSFWIAH